MTDTTARRFWGVGRVGAGDGTDMACGVGAQAELDKLLPTMRKVMDNQRHLDSWSKRIDQSSKNVLRKLEQMTRAQQNVRRESSRQASIPGPNSSPVVPNLPLIRQSARSSEIGIDPGRGPQ